MTWLRSKAVAATDYRELARRRPSVSRERLVWSLHNTHVLAATRSRADPPHSVHGPGVALPGRRFGCYHPRAPRHRHGRPTACANKPPSATPACLL